MYLDNNLLVLANTLLSLVVSDLRVDGRWIRY